jgi:hypothetical protein
MKKELDIFEIMLYLDKEDLEQFYEWYITHPYCKGIRDIHEFVRGQSDKGD